MYKEDLTVHTASALQTLGEHSGNMWTVEGENPLGIVAVSSSKLVADMFQLSSAVANFFRVGCRATLNDSRLLEGLRREHFDLGIAEYFDGCGVGLFHAVGLENTILTASSLIFETLSAALGVPDASAYVPGWGGGTPFEITTPVSGTHTSYSSEELVGSVWKRMTNLLLTEGCSRTMFSVIKSGAQKGALDVHPNFPDFDVCSAFPSTFPWNPATLKRVAGASSADIAGLH